MLCLMAVVHGPALKLEGQGQKQKDGTKLDPSGRDVLKIISVALERYELRFGSAAGNSDLHVDLLGDGNVESKEMKEAAFTHLDNFKELQDQLGQLIRDLQAVQNKPM